MEWEIKRLKRSRIPLVKVRWNSRRGPKFTWECKDSFKKKYPHLFTNRTSSSTTRIYTLPFDLNNSMDKSWIRTSRTKKQYIDGVKAFIKYAVHNLQKMRNIDPRDFNMDFGSEHPTDGPATVKIVNATKESFDEDDLAKFQELLLDTEKPLYNGCPNFKKLSVIVKVLNLKDSQAWCIIDENFPEIAKDLRNLRLGISADRVDINSRTRTLLNVLGKTKDGMNDQLDLAELGIKPELFARKEISLQELDKLQLELVVTLCLLKKFFPLNRPEGCIAEETIAEEIIEFLANIIKP
nr:putative reverse transcriptase domain-containing protein [Tanacetum cinerariifolium]